MDLLWLLVLVFLFLAVFGNPIAGPRVYQGYSYGYFPSILGVIVAVILVVWLLGGHHLHLP